MSDPIISRDNIGNCKRLEGKAILVTAGTLGIGRAIVERCVQEGAFVFLCSRKQVNVDETVKEVTRKYQTKNIGGCSCNVGDPKDLEAFVSKSFEFLAGLLKVKENEVKIDGLVSNAAVNPHFGPSLDATDASYTKIFQINIESAWRLVKIVHPRLRPGSSIVFVSSIGGFMPGPPLGLYGVSKSALNSLTKTLSLELGHELIRVNCVAPGLIKTKFSEALWKGKEEEAEKPVKTAIPRIGQPVDIAGPVAFLLSEDAEYVTGETLIISGGRESRI